MNWLLEAIGYKQPNHTVEDRLNKLEKDFTSLGSRLDKAEKQLKSLCDLIKHLKGDISVCHENLGQYLDTSITMKSHCDLLAAELADVQHALRQNELVFSVDVGE